MSRSYRHNTILGMTYARSEKKDKRYAHHVERTRVRNVLANASEEDDVVVDNRKQAFSNVYDFAKDGKQHIDMQVKHIRRGLKVLKMPQWLKQQGLRGVHKVLAK